MILFVKKKSFGNKKKSRVQWTSDGDRNTRFFHMATLVRRNNNKVDSLMVNGEWCFDHEILKAHVSNHFLSLYSADPPVVHRDSLSGTRAVLDASLVPSLLRPITSDDVKCALDSIGPPLKAPGPDGISAVFFKNHWDIVQPSLTRMVSKAFQTGSFPNVLNHSYISLIPKVSSPETVKQLRPISLSNVVYKLVTKVLVQKIRPFLSDMISPFQSSFVPKRNPADNIILVQEVVAKMRKKTGKKGMKLLDRRERE